MLIRKLPLVLILLGSLIVADTFAAVPLERRYDENGNEIVETDNDHDNPDSHLEDSEEDQLDRKDRETIESYHREYLQPPFQERLKETTPATRHVPIFGHAIADHYKPSKHNDSSDHLFMTAINGDSFDPSKRDENHEDSKLNYYIWNMEEYPNPVLTPRFCRRDHPSAICDPDDVLKPSQARALEKLVGRIGSELDCYCPSCPVGKHGLSVGVALMAGIYRPFNVRPRENIEEFSDFIRKRWHLGACDNDVIIVLAVKDQQIYTSLGEKAKEILPRNATKKIYESAKPFLASGQYYEGIESMVNSYYEVLKEQEDALKRPTPEPPLQRPDDKEQPNSKLGLILGLVFGILVVLILVGLGVWWYYRRQGDDADEEVDHDWRSIVNSWPWQKKKTPTSGQGVEKGNYEHVPTKEDMAMAKAAPYDVNEEEISSEDEEADITSPVVAQDEEPIEYTPAPVYSEPRTITTTTTQAPPMVTAKHIETEIQ